MIETPIDIPKNKGSLTRADVQFDNLGFKSINPLVTAAIPSLLIITEIKKMDHADKKMISELGNRAITSIKNFAYNAEKLHCDMKNILIGKYILCAAIDESVMLSNWESRDVWSNKTLLSIVYKETWGGERFFSLLSETEKNPKDNLFVLELFYIILSLGFEGKYYEQNYEILDNIKNKLFKNISLFRLNPEMILSPTMSLIINKNKTEKTYSKYKIPIISFVVFVLVFATVNIMTYSTANKLLRDIKKMTLSISMNNLSH